MRPIAGPFVFVHATAVWLLAAPLPSGAQEPVWLREQFPANYHYRVNCRVELAGTLTLPTEKGLTTPKQVAVTGNSALEYDERVLALKEGQVRTTVRLYHRLD